jgi:hypothetical protein
MKNERGYASHQATTCQRNKNPVLPQLKKGGKPREKRRT